MGQPFGHWASEVAAVQDEGDVRALIGKIGHWRATRLVDVGAQRAASWALSELHLKLGARLQAESAARELMSLCQAAPEASGEELRFARGHLGRFESGRRGESAPRPPREGGRGERPPRGDGDGGRREDDRRGADRRDGGRDAVRDLLRPDGRSSGRADGGRADARRTDGPPARADGRGAGRAEERSAGRGAERRSDDGRGALDGAIASMRAGDLAATAAQLGGARGPRAELVRAWLGLGEALSGPASMLVDRVDAVRAQIAASFAERAAEPARHEPERQDVDDPIAALIGAPLPSGRDAAIDAMNAFAAANPDRADALAAVSLRHHVASRGVREPAPWLAGLVGRALALDGAETRAAIEELAAQGAFAVTAYSEAAFGVAVDALRAVFGAGGQLVSLRRGVLHRGESPERRVWTLRVALSAGVAAGERLLALVAADAGYDAAMSNRIARRLAELSPATLVSAPGAGLEDLRAAAGAAGIAVSEETDGAALITALGAVVPAAAEAPAGEAPRRAAAEPRERRPSPALRLSALFTESADAEAYAEVLAELRRSFLAFSAIRRAASDMTPDAIDARLPALLTAVHHSAPAEVRLAEGTTLAVRIAAAVPGGATEAMLLGGSEAGARYGGPGIAGLITLTRAVTAAGGRLDRVLSGVSRREREAQPGLAALERNLGGLWRLLVGRDGRRGEAWWLDGLTPEGQAAVPLLMLDARPRVVFAADPGVAPGASSLDAAAAALDDAFHAWPVSAALSDDEEGS